MPRRNYATPEQIRIKLGLNQSQFWGTLGCSQSAGSRYESGERKLAKPVEILYRAVYLGHPLPRAPR